MFNIFSDGMFLTISGIGFNPVLDKPINPSELNSATVSGRDVKGLPFNHRSSSFDNCPMDSGSAVKEQSVKSM